MADTVLNKNAKGYGYKYTDLAQIHEYLEATNQRYYQFISTKDGNDYVFTQKQLIDENGKVTNNGEPLQGCRIVQATLQGIKNPAQEQGSALTYARRYSLLMAFGLATDDDDGAKLTVRSNNVKKAIQTRTEANKQQEQKIAEKKQGLTKWLQDNKVSSDVIINALSSKGYNKVEEIKTMEDIESIFNAIQKVLGGTNNE